MISIDVCESEKERTTCEMYGRLCGLFIHIICMSQLRPISDAAGYLTLYCPKCRHDVNIMRAEQYPWYRNPDAGTNI